jgi:hypothetical protein
MAGQEQDLFLECVADILIRCFLMTIALLFVWFIFFVFAGGFVYELHSRWFDLEWYDLNWFFYIGMATLKVIAFVFFLFPYIAIRLVLRKSKT